MSPLSAVLKRNNIHKLSGLQIPIVDDEMRKAAGEDTEEDTQMAQGSVQKLVTADGTYATQSAFSASTVKKPQDRCVIILLPNVVFTSCLNPLCGVGMALEQRPAKLWVVCSSPIG